MKQIVALLILLLSVAALTHAQPRNVDRFTIQVGGSGAFAIDRLGNFADAGVGGALGIELRPLTTVPELSLRFTGHYLMFMARADGEPDVTVAAAIGDLKLSPSWQSDTRLYLFAGTGYGSVELKDHPAHKFLVDSLTTEKKPLVELGIGMERKTGSGLGYFVEISGVNMISDRFGDYRFGRLTFGLLF